ncbi:SAP domain-containing protein [Lentzea sp. NPDC092896]|uniref:SAP domain-containing protein n=1 Tax=Lentzea sp. NPDC092896 TaxID=3364127 RepID=UPI003826D4FA
MPKITVHGGPSIAGETPVLLEAGEHVVSREAAAEVAAAHLAQHEEDAATTPTSVVGDQGPGVADETLGGDFKPLPEAVEGDTTEHVSEPDYESWTVKQLREVLADRELATTGLKDELIARLREADAAASDG